MGLIGGSAERLQSNRMQDLSKGGITPCSLPHSLPRDAVGSRVCFWVSSGAETADTMGLRPAKAGRVQEEC